LAGVDAAAPWAELAAVLRSLESFYDVLGGAVGYQLTALRLVQEAEAAHAEPPPASLQGARFHRPQGLDLAAQPERGLLAAAAGLRSLPVLGELYPLGGAGDRLGLRDEASGEALPVALLPYCGRSLLEVLLRDLAAREFLHFRLCGVQLRTPVAVMTSAAKGNHSRLLRLCEARGWFGRGADGFMLFQQPLVPVLNAASGAWLLCGPGSLLLKPGGHGAVWKLARDCGVLDWLQVAGAEAVLVRQISNPLADTDTTLLALAGEGRPPSRAFGFVSCCRSPGAAEGVNVLTERPLGGGAWEYNVSNLEYTEFARLGLSEQDAQAFPANTNVLYVKLRAVREALGRGVAGALPGLLVNLSKPQAAFGEPLPVRSGRLECSMQSLADSLAQRSEAPLPPSRWAELATFCVSALRRRATSSAKRRLERGPAPRLSQTPEGSYLDLLRNGRDMLGGGGMALPDLGGDAEYLRHGPSFLLRWHPALGPLWHIVAQKVRGGALAPRSELELEASEVDLQGLHVHGSLLLRATEPLGGPAGAYSGAACGRARLVDVTVRNAGVDWEAPENVYWAARIRRHETCEIILHGCVHACGVLACCLLTPIPAGTRRLMRPT